MTRYDIINLGKEFADENDAAFDLWTWLPSHEVTKKHHNDYADEFRPSIKDIMYEASMYMSSIKYGKNEIHDDWFNRCCCGESHEE